jgi:hypothetical protein
MSAPEITWEVRWFFKGSIPEKEVGDWFLNNPRFGERLIGKHGKKREDLYLLTPGNTSIGAKLREGRFEIKLLQDQQELELAGGGSGKSEVWHKWKWPYARGKKDTKINELITGSFMASTHPKLRVMVRKKRWQRKFTVTGPGELAPLPGREKGPTWWLSAELTGLQVGESPWWTLALEFCENREARLPLLQQSLSWILQDYAGLPLKLQDSYSYPEWLAILGEF